jgi:hypothetical protein
MRAPNVQLRINNLSDQIATLHDLSSHLNTDAKKIYLANLIKQLQITSQSLNQSSKLSDAFVIDYTSMLESYINLIAQSDYDMAEVALDAFMKKHPKPCITLANIASTLLFLAIFLAPLPLVILMTPIFSFLFIASFLIADAISNDLFKEMAITPLDEFNAADSIGITARAMHGLFSGKISSTDDNKSERKHDIYFTDREQQTCYA